MIFDDTIAAIATPTGSGGIGIIRISGPSALSIAASIFRKASNKHEVKSFPCSLGGMDSFASHRLYYGYVIDSGKVLDEVLLAVMKTPRSYTREDVIEIHAHSGTVVLRAILNLVLQKGARLAEPGEFTRRAFINGRIDLTQAEAVIDVINAKTAKSLEIATAQIRGGLKTRVESIRNFLLQIMAQTEAAIDFPDDVGEDIRMEAIVETLQTNAGIPLNELVALYQHAHFFRDGVKVCIAGRPNVGKSSLLNCLVQKERAIVTAIPGTTRDVIEEPITFCGIPAIMTDTAGLHQTDDPVEVIGIQKAYDAVETSDIVLFMIDAASPFTEKDFEIYKRINHKPLILVINKSDLISDTANLTIPEPWNKISFVKISALYHKGIEELKDFIAATIIGKGLDAVSPIIPNFRQKIALERSLNAVSLAIEGILKGMPFEMVNIDIRESIDALGEIIGMTTTEDVLDQIFEKFCIGK